MSFVKCFDVVSAVVGEAANQFAPLWKLDDESYRILEQYCSVFDSMSEEFDGRLSRFRLMRLRRRLQLQWNVRMSHSYPTVICFTD